MKQFLFIFLFAAIISCTNNNSSEAQDSAKQEVVLDKIEKVEEQTKVLENEIEEIGTEVEELNDELDNILKDL